MNRIRWMIYGVLFGLLFPMVAITLRLNSFGFSETLQLFLNDRLLWIILTAPLFLGTLAYFAGLQNDKLQKLHHSLEGLVLERTKSLQLLQVSYVQAAKMAALGEMTGGIAHELNTPLAVISLHMDSMNRAIEKGELDEHSLAKSVGAISKAVDRMVDIIKKLRNFSSFSPSQENKTQELLDINIALKDVVALYSARLGENGVECFIVNSQLPAMIAISRPDFLQVMMSLIENSVFAVKELDEKWIRIGVSEDRVNVFLLIEDSGNGIPDEIAMKIFQPFYTTKELGQGVGLGLSSALGIIQTYGGVLEYVPGSNTAFRITIPKSSLLKSA